MEGRRFELMKRQKKFKFVEMIRQGGENEAKFLAHMNQTIAIALVSPPLKPKFYGKGINLTKIRTVKDKLYVFWFTTHHGVKDEIADLFKNNESEIKSELSYSTGGSQMPALVFQY
eukprot:maker-scaffold1187_size56475-snap-gene-0.10 protein:Tk02809 transcript:maker-scaffold1187_size56475-snap-gene-0.10-mRNA-1 annotation:"PREDICTED: uncharacterized protein LOC103525049"